MGETRVKRGAKIDSLVQVGHACVVGEDNIICAQTGLAGSSILEKNVLLAGQVGISGHLTIHDNAVIYAQSGIGGDVAAGAVMSGSPAFEAREWLRAITAFPKLPDLLKTVRQLEKRLERPGSAQATRRNDRRQLPINGHRPVAYRNETFLDSPDARGLAHSLGIPGAAVALSRREDPGHDRLLRIGADQREGPLGQYYRDARTLARLVTEWSNKLRIHVAPLRDLFAAAVRALWKRPIAARRDAGGKTIGLNIGLPFEQRPNPYITPELSLRVPLLLHAQVLVRVSGQGAGDFPGRIRNPGRAVRNSDAGADPEAGKKIVIVLYGSKFWKEVLNFDALVKHGIIDREDLNLFQYADDPGNRAGDPAGTVDPVFPGAGEATAGSGAGNSQIAKSRV